MRIKTIIRSGAGLVILVGIFVLSDAIDLFATCDLSDYMCVFSKLLKICAILTALYIGSKLIL